MPISTFDVMSKLHDPRINEHSPYVIKNINDFVTNMENESVFFFFFMPRQETSLQGRINFEHPLYQP